MLLLLSHSTSWELFLPRPLNDACRRILTLSQPPKIIRKGFLETPLSRRLVTKLLLPSKGQRMSRSVLQTCLSTCLTNRMTFSAPASCCVMTRFWSPVLHVLVAPKLFKSPTQIPLRPSYRDQFSQPSLSLTSRPALGSTSSRWSFHPFITLVGGQGIECSWMTQL